MNQKLSLSLFFGGLSAFLTSFGELLTVHSSWHELSTPNEVGHIILITATFCVAITGALGLQLPRSGGNDRIGDKVDLNKINKENL